MFTIAKRTDYGLMALSFVLWLPLPVVPFLSLETPEKAGLATALFGGAEVTFWLGAVLAGRDAASRFSRWRGRRRDASPQ